MATLGAAGVEVAQSVLAETQTAILPLVPYLDTLRWVFIAVALGGIAVTIYARLDDWRAGASMIAGCSSRDRRQPVDLAASALRRHRARRAPVPAFASAVWRASGTPGRTPLRQWRRSMMSNARCWMRRLAVPRHRDELAQRLRDGSVLRAAGSRRARLWSSTAGSSEARAAEEVASLPERSAIAEMLADYSVTQDQARLCR